MRYWFRQTVGILALIAIAALASAQTTTTTAPSDSFPAKPFTIRQGIGNVAAKLKGGQTVTIAFLGGPITGSGGDRGYVELVMTALRSQNPGRDLRLVNAGFIDGGSPLGAARYERDVLPHKPDLLFVEFAADDTGKDDRQRQVERIVQKAWSADPTTDIVFLYALEESHLADYRAGKLPPAAALHERVAAHYGIPSIAMGIDLVTRLDAGKARWAEQFYDAARPTPTGHEAYATAISTALQAMLTDATAASTVKHELKAPVSPNFYLHATTRPATTMPAPPAMVDNDGRTAKATYAMPVIGTHWVGSPDYADADGRILWRLFTQSARDNGRRLNANFGLDRSRWGGPMRWFDEWAYFTGPAGVYLAHSTNNKTNNLNAREDDLPVLTFTAPRAGRYLVRLKSGSVALWGMHRTLALNVVHFPAGQTKGTSVAFDRAVRRAAEPVRMEFEVRLAEGDDLAFELDTNATGGGGGAAYLDVDLQIGWFGE